jgi:hypothetical protein
MSTVVKMSHNSYQTHVQSKRQEVIKFRNELIQRFTNPLAKINQNKEYKRLNRIKFGGRRGTL